MEPTSPELSPADAAPLPAALQLARLAPSTGVPKTDADPAKVDDPAKVQEPPRIQASRPDVSRRTRALIVDDDRMMRLATGALLDAFGYDGVEAASGAAAIEMFRERPGQFAFVLLDVGMHGMSGTDALRKLVEIDPDVRVVLCTGHPREYLERDVFNLGAVEYLFKPYDRESLRAMIDRVTGQAPEAPGSNRSSP